MNQTLSPQLSVIQEITEVKRIFSSIETSLFKKTPACLLVTSAVRGEGKTLTVAGIAVTAARNPQKRVLTVDLNWHSPSLHDYFGLNTTNVENLHNGVSVKELVQKTSINNLDVLTAIQTGSNGGPPHTDDNMIAAEIIEQARAEYEIIILDSSKIFPTNRRMLDPVEISKAADGVAIVVSGNRTPRQQVKRAKTLLETAGANLVGLVYNQSNWNGNL